MTSHVLIHLPRLLAVLALLVPTVSRAQVCLGSPSGTSVALETGTFTVGRTQGATATLGGGATAVSLGARTRDISSSYAGKEANVRIAITLGPSRFQVCPLVGIGLRRDEWEITGGSTLNSNTLMLRGGAGVGMEHPLPGGLSVIPFLVAQYQFTAIHLDLEIPGADENVTGDTLSYIDFEYGLMARYRFLYGGVAANRTSRTEGSHPYMARWILGLSFSGFASRRESTPGAGFAPERRRD